VITRKKFGKTVKNSNFYGEKTIFPAKNVDLRHDRTRICLFLPSNAHFSPKNVTFLLKKPPFLAEKPALLPPHHPLFSL